MSVGDIRNMRLWRSAAFRKLQLCRLLCTHDLIVARATKSGRPAKFYLAAAACGACTNLWGWPYAEALAASLGSDAASISITYAYVEPSENQVRRGSADIKLKNVGLVILRSIQCDDGSVAHVYFPPRRAADGLAGLINYNLTIRAPGLDLVPGAAFNISNPVPGHPESKFLSCTFDFADFDPVRVSFHVVKSIGNLHDF